MLDIMERSHGDTLGVRATGKLSQKQYTEYLMPRLERLFARHGRLNLLFYMDKDFAGWDLAGSWEDLSLGLHHRHDFGRLALVGGPEWVRLGLRLSGFLIRAEIRLFEAADLDAAWTWVESGGAVTTAA